MAQKSKNELKINYLHGDQSSLDQVSDMWEKLNGYHCKRSKYFKGHYLGMTWQKRKTVLIEKAAGGELCVIIARLESTGRNIGYVISSVNSKKIGEVESIYVESAYRRMGIGKALMEDGLLWMDHKGATSKQVEVSFGNERAWEFYKRFCFLPRSTLLKLEEYDFYYGEKEALSQIIST